MKQKFIYVVLLMTAVYLPASSRECGKLVTCPLVTAPAALKDAAATTIEEASVLPSLPLNKALFNL